MKIKIKCFIFKMVYLTTLSVNLEFFLTKIFCLVFAIFLKYFFVEEQPHEFFEKVVDGWV